MLRSSVDSRQPYLGRRRHGSASASESTPILPVINTKSTEPYDRAFQQHLIGHSTYHNSYKYPNGQAPATAERQACNNGALGARVMSNLRMYGNPEEDRSNK